MKCKFRGWVGICLVFGFLWDFGRGEKPKLSEEDGYGTSHERQQQLRSNDFIKALRPRTAREAFRLAGRIAEKEVKKEPRQSFSLLYENGVGGRVDVQDVVEATTSRWNYRGFRRFNKVRERNEWPDSDSIEDPPSMPALGRKFGHEKTLRKTENEKIAPVNHKKMKQSRTKRDVGDNDSGFNLPPMSQEWRVKLKKKKKKKKKTTEAPVIKKIQTKSKKSRLFMDSGEIDPKMKKSRRKPNYVRDLSKELDNLLNNEEEFELATSAPTEPPVIVRTQKASTKKFVDIPSNWQQSPSWKPPTLRPKPPTFEESEDEESATFDWRNYENPLNPSTHKIEIKPGPDDWPHPTHPSDGIYDWHKTQIRMGHTSLKPYFAANDRNIPHPTWVWSNKPKEDNIYLRNDMWQTRPWIPQVKTLSTWPPIATRAAFTKTFERMEPNDAFLEKTPQVLGRKGNQRKTGLMEEVHLTAGPPLATVDQPLEVGALQPESGSFSLNNQQENVQYSYNYGPQHSSWQSNTQGQQKSSQGIEQYQSYQNYHANHSSNSYSQYYQHYETRLGNKSAEVHYESGHHYEDPQQASGHYQAQYQYQEKPKGHQQQLPQQQQSRIMPPAYFYSVHNELTTLDPDVSTMKIPFRGPDEYAGNDRDLRAPLPHRPVYEYPDGQSNLYPTKGWLGYRFNRMGPRRGFGSRFRRPMFRTIFQSPLQKDTWTTVLPQRPTKETL